MLFATVRQRKIHVKQPVDVIQNGIAVDWLKLDMDDEWQTMERIVCTFTNGDTVIEKLHTFGEDILVPWECLTETGSLTVSCAGYVGEEKLMTTMLPDSAWNVVQNGPITGDEEFDPTPTLAQQLLALATSAEESASAAAEDAADAREAAEEAVTAGDAAKAAAQASAAAASASANSAANSASSAEQSATAASASRAAAAQSSGTAQNAAQTAGAEADRAEAAANTYPYIGDNKNWFVWNTQTEQYEDTGVAARGPKGDKGDPGQGASAWDDLTDKPFSAIGDNLKVVNGALTVDTAPNVQQDNTKPITSAAVYVEVGNINALLALI